MAAGKARRDTALQDMAPADTAPSDTAAAARLPVAQAAALAP